MKLMKYALLAATVAGSLTVAAAPADAQRNGWRDDRGRWHNGNRGWHRGWRQVCQWRWRHHRRVRVCWRVHR